MLNLAVNARDAMPGGGELTVAAREEEARSDRPDGPAPGRHVVLSVIDTGEGMDEATLARATEPFFTTKAPGEGTGLGLATVRDFAVQSGGWFLLHSRKGSGTTAEFTALAERVSGQDLDAFFTTWLYSTGKPAF